MKLPFLKERTWPRIAKPMDEKAIGLSPSEQLEDYCMDELFEAAMNKDVDGFRKAVEALVLNCFDLEGAPDAF